MECNIPCIRVFVNPPLPMEKNSMLESDSVHTYFDELVFLGKDLKCFMVTSLKGNLFENSYVN